MLAAFLLPALLVPLLAAPAEPSGASQDAERSPRLILESAEGTLSERPCQGLSVEDFSRLEAVLVRLEDAAAVGPASAVEGDVAEVRSTRGETFLASIRGGRGDHLLLRLLAGLELQVSADELESLVFARRLAAGQAAALAPAPKSDVLHWIRSAGLDRIEGRLEAFEDGGLRFESAVLGERGFAWSELGALHIEKIGATEELEARGTDPAHPEVEVELADGGRLRGRFVRLDERGLALQRGEAQALLVPLGAVAEIAAADGRIAFLSDLEPRFDPAREGSPFGDGLGCTWPPRRDRSVMGGALRSGGRAFTRGLGVHAPSRLTFALAGSWRSLRGLAAIDDSALLLPSRGSVVFRIRLDGEVRWESGVVASGEAPRVLPAIDLSGARELVLEVDMDGDLHVADRANWLRLLLVGGR